MSLPDILEIENSEELATLRCPSTGILAWPALRNRFLRSIISDLLYEERIDTPHDSHVSSIAKASAALKYVTHNALSHDAQGAICLMASGRGHSVAGGRWSHPLNDSLYEACPGTAFMFEDHFNWVVPKHRTTRVHYHMPYQGLAALRGHFPDRQHVRMAAEVVEIVTTRAHSLLGWAPSDLQRKRFEVILAGKLAATPLMFDRYRRFLGQSGARILIAQSGCYGPAATVISAAKSLGIKTAEFQHGAITKGHDAYNVAPVMFNSAAYKNTLPDTLLCFGTWWTNQIGVPVKTTAIGNPLRPSGAQNDHGIPSRRNRIVVLGDGVDTKRYLGLCNSAAPGLVKLGFELIFRPHPLERHKFAGDLPDQRFSVDMNPSLQDTLDTAHSIISEASSGLFDAAGIVHRILVWNTPKSKFNLPTHPFHTFDDAEDLLDKISMTDNVQPIDVEAIWRSGWKDAYKDFIRNEIGPDCSD